MITRRVIQHNGPGVMDEPRSALGIRRQQRRQQLAVSLCRRLADEGRCILSALPSPPYRNPARWPFGVRDDV